MSRLASPDRASELSVETIVRAWKVAPAGRAMAAHTHDTSSPTTSIGRVMATIVTCLVMALFVNARAVVHDSEALPDGLTRAVLLDVGHAALGIAGATHLTWPRDQLDAALGHAPPPAESPLLASGAGQASPLLAPTATARSVRPVRRAGAAKAAVAAHPAMKRGPARRITPPARRVAPSSGPALQVGTAYHGRWTPTAPPPIYPMPRPGTRPPSRLAAAPGAHPTLHRAATPGTHGTPRPITAPGAARRHGEPPDTLHGRPTPITRLTRVPPFNSHPAVPLSRDRPVHRATALLLPGVHAVSAARPLRLLVTGDSLPGYLGPELINEAAAIAPVQGIVDIHDGTGLTRPDFVDWSLVARQQLTNYRPDAVVVWIGGNDFQNMTLPDGQFFQAGTPAWTREYARRAEICMRIWAQGGRRRVYWLSMPPARARDWAHDDGQINIALQHAAARVRGAEYVNILAPITDHGRYSDYVYQNGTPVLVRESDGVHVNIAGSHIVAHSLLALIAREWRLGATA